MLAYVREGRSGAQPQAWPIEVNRKTFALTAAESPGFDKDADQCDEQENEQLMGESYRRDTKSDGVDARQED